jgi:hypothetical protein
MTPFYNSALWGGWGELFVAHGEYDIPHVYMSDLAALPRRTLQIGASAHRRYGGRRFITA